ncbi:endonuclease/exonuclease/phosphatase family protein [Luteimicrobium sp. DT211]|uniref:endonuclease/exonuclease/phosphatase family protein n=1 Tax=Luteimicrobium sp. DT211 TaxID=3393412 RepID=UPI003CEC5783
MRLLSYNVRSLKQDRHAVLTVLRETDADVVALQEPPKWWLTRERLHALARDAGLTVAVPGGIAGARTTALLVRPGVEVVGMRPLRLPLKLVRRGHWFPTLRGAAVARLRLPAADGVDAFEATVASVHLSLDDDERAGHQALIEAAVGELSPGGWGDVVVAGDLNEEPGGPAWEAFGVHGLADAGAGDGRPTFSTKRPRKRLDVVLVGPRLTGVARRVDLEVLARASDHFPVVAEVLPLG